MLDPTEQFGCLTLNTRYNFGKMYSKFISKDIQLSVLKTYYIFGIIKSPLPQTNDSHEGCDVVGKTSFKGDKVIDRRLIKTMWCC